MVRWFRRRPAVSDAVERVPPPEVADPRAQAETEVLYAQAVGHDPAARRSAQERLAGAPGIGERVRSDLLLADDHRRVVSAEWLARLGDPDAVTAISTALKTERVDRVRSAMFDAIEALGEPVGPHTDLEAFDRAARLTASRPMPPLLVDFPWHDVPPLRAADSGVVLDQALAKHLVVLAVRARDTRPDARLRYLASRVWRDDAEAFARVTRDFWERHGRDPRRRGLLAVIAAFGVHPQERADVNNAENPLSTVDAATYRGATRKGGGPINE